MEVTKRSSWWDNVQGFLKRIGYLTKIQASQKFKFATSKTRLVISFIIKFIVAIVVALLIDFLLDKVNYMTSGGISPNENLFAFILAFYLIISLISAIASVISQIYRSTDNEFLFAFPVKPQEVFVSKVLLVLLQEFLNSIFILLPILIGFKLSTNVEISFVLNRYTLSNMYYVISALMLFILPLLTVGIALLISIPIVYISNFIKRHIYFKLIFVALLFVGYILLANILLGGLLETINFSTQLRVISMKVNVFLSQFVNVTVVFGFLSLIFSRNYVHILIVLSLSLILFILAYYILKPLYFRLVLSGNGIKVKAKAKGINKQKSPFLSILNKDLNMLFSKGGDFTKYFLLAFIAPCIVLIINRVFGTTELSRVGESLVLAVNIASIGMFMNMSCVYVSTALTQEGANFYLTKTAPISYKKQIIIKFIINLVINAIIILACCVIMTTATILTFKQGLLCMGCLIITNFGHLCYALMQELSSPMIDWFDVSEISRHKVIRKSNIAGLLLGLIFGMFAFKFYYIAPTRAWFELLILAFIIAGYNLYLLLRRHNYYLNQINK